MRHNEAVEECILVEVVQIDLGSAELRTMMKMFMQCRAFELTQK